MTQSSRLLPILPGILRSQPLAASLAHPIS
jgi:hypothetical protein